MTTTDTGASALFIPSPVLALNAAGPSVIPDRPSAGDTLARAFLAIIRREQGLPPLAASASLANGAAGNASDASAQDYDALIQDLLRVSQDDTAMSGRMLRPELALATILTARAIATDLTFLREVKGAAPAATITTGDDDWNDHVGTVVTSCVIGSHRVTLHAATSYVRGDKPAAMVLIRDEEDRKTSGSDKDVTHAISNKLILIGIAPNPQRDLSKSMNRVATWRFVLPPIDASAVALMIEAVTGRPPSRAIRPDLVRLVDITDLGLVFRPGMHADEALGRLETLLAQKTQHDGSGPSLEELAGYAEAKEWGLALVADLDAWKAGAIGWDDIDGRGLLLSGPPGVGKTSFAKALAKSARVPLVATSVAQWNATEHLGSTLKAVRKCFAEARKRAPCILLIDELDGISDRARLSGDYVEYWAQIVNCLLEELAGVEGREGVIVIGCSNHPDRIDPAVRRAGRLDRQIGIKRPEAGDLALIFRHHLGADILPSVDLMPVAVRAEGKSGADVEAFCRRAKAAARRAKRNLTLDDLMAEVRAADLDRTGRTLLSPERRRAIAVHEAGHAVMMHHVGDGVAWLNLTERGGMTASVETFELRGETDVKMLLLTLLAGHAAETVIFGNREIAEISLTSDLARATAVATQYELQSGKGVAGLVQYAALHSVEMPVGSPLHQAVNARLEAAMADAVAILSIRKPAIEALAAALDRDGFVSGATAVAIMDAHTICHVDHPGANAFALMASADHDCIVPEHLGHRHGLQARTTGDRDIRPTGTGPRNQGSPIIVCAIIAMAPEFNQNLITAGYASDRESLNQRPSDFKPDLGINGRMNHPHSARFDTALVFEI
jgi:cell division protease FtsH